MILLFCNILGNIMILKYRSLVKEWPTPTFGPISCIGSKFMNERQSWSELRMEFEKHSLKRYAYLTGKKLRVILHRSCLLQGIFA